MVSEQLEFDFDSSNYDPLKLIEETGVKYILSLRNRKKDEGVIVKVEDILNLRKGKGDLIPGPKPWPYEIQERLYWGFFGNFGQEVA